MRILKIVMLTLLAVYLLPGLAAAGLWATREHPRNWREATWTPSGLLSQAAPGGTAHVAVLTAQTGGFKGAFAVHRWIVVRHSNTDQYDRYDVVGWGKPVRKNAYPPDGRWYSNVPEIVWQASGDAAERLIPKIESAIAQYPHQGPGAYRLWPGPNSNTFVASVMRAVPEIDAVLPGNAVGRDYLENGRFLAYDSGDAHMTLYGLIGLSVGVRSGLEIHLLGLVAGFDLNNPGIKVPAFGRIGV